MGFLDRIFAAGVRAGGSSSDTSAADTDTVRKIVSRLESLPPERARFVAAFAYVLSRVAHADLDISKAETERMEELVRRHGELPEEQAVLVVEIAKAQNRLFGETEDFLVTRELAAIASDDERREMLDAALSVAAADGSISGQEEARVKQIASELGFSRAAYVEALAAWREHRSIFQNRD